MITPEAIAALITASLTTELRREAAGVYCLSNEPTVYAHDNDYHPIKLWFSNPSQRSAILNSNHTIAAIMFFDIHGILKIVSNPRTTMDDASRTVVVGHLGDTMIYPAPVSVSYDDIVGDVIGFLPSSYVDSFNGIMDNVPATNRTYEAQDNDQANDHLTTIYRLPSIPTYAEENVLAHQASLPTSIPLFFSHGLGDGNYDISQHETLTSLQTHLADIHPILGDWIKAMRYLQVNYEGHGIQDTTKFPNHKEVLMQTSQNNHRPTILTGHESIPESSSMATAIFGEIRRLSTKNVMEWFESHQDDHPSIAATIEQLQGGKQNQSPSGTLPNAPLTVTAPANLDDKATERRKERAAASWKVLLSSRQDDVLVLPTLSKPMMAAINEPKPANAVSPLKNSLKETIRQMKTDKTYLSTMTSFNTNVINVAWLTAFSTASFFDGNLNSDDEHSPINKTFSVFNVLKARTTEKTYTAVIDETQAVSFEARQSISSSKRTTPSANLYTDGAQETYSDVLSAIANLIGICKWAVDGSGNDYEEPSLVKDLTDIFNLVSDDIFKTTFDRLITNWPWMGHSIIAEIQGIFQARAEVAMIESYIESAIDGADIDADAFKVYELRLADVKDVLGSILANTNRVSNIYAGEPVSYLLFRPADHPITKRRKTNETQSQPAPNRSHQAAQGAQGSQGSQGTQGSQDTLGSRGSQRQDVVGSHPDKGFLQITARGIVYPILSNNKTMCGNWATVGKSCPYGRACFRSHMYWPTNNQQDRQIVENWVNTTPGVTFTTPDRRVTFQQAPPGARPGRFQANNFQPTGNGNNNTNNRRQGNHQGNQRANGN